MLSGGWTKPLILFNSMINNVGGGIGGVRLHEISEEAWDASMCVHYKVIHEYVYLGHVISCIIHGSFTSVLINLRALGEIFIKVLLLKSSLGISTFAARS